MGSCEHFGMVARLTPTGFNMMILFAVQTHERLTTRNLLLHKCCNYSRHGASLQVDYLMKRLPTYQCLSQHQLHALLFSSPDTTRNLIKRNVWISQNLMCCSRHHTSFTAPVQVPGKDTCGTSFCLQPFVETVRESG